LNNSGPASSVDWKKMSEMAVKAIRAGKDPKWVKSEYERLTGRKANF
jgi:hypothetical protein